MSRLTKFLAGALFLASSVIAADYTIKFSHVVSADTPKGQAADFFAKRVGELTEGKVEVIVFPSSQLYDDGAVLKALKLGNVQMAAPALSKFTSIVPAMQLFDLPFLFKDMEHIHRVMDGEVGENLKNQVSKKGFIALDFWDNGLKNFSSNKQPILSPDDTKGQKVRIMSSKVLEAQMGALGANSQILPYSEVYSALQQGVVDAAENPLANFYTEKFYEVQSSMTVTDHGFLGYLVIASEKFWKKFPEDLKPKVLQAMKEATQKQRELAKQLESEYMKKVEEYAKNTGKIKIYKISDEQKEAFVKATQSVYPKFHKTIGKDLIEKAQALRNK